VDSWKSFWWCRKAVFRRRGTCPTELNCLALWHYPDTQWAFDASKCYSQAIQVMLQTTITICFRSQMSTRSRPYKKQPYGHHLTETFPVHFLTRIIFTSTLRSRDNKNSYWGIEDHTLRVKWSRFQHNATKEFRSIGQPLGCDITITINKRCHRFRSGCTVRW
jgi:hypothetical protein